MEVLARAMGRGKRGGATTRKWRERGRGNTTNTKVPPRAVAVAAARVKARARVRARSAGRTNGRHRKTLRPINWLPCLPPWGEMKPRMSMKMKMRAP